MEESINGQGVRLVQQAEGKDVPLLKPWEVEGEKEALADTSALAIIEDIESSMKLMHKHNETCTNPQCDKAKIFDEIMDIRRNHLTLLLSHGYHAFFEASYAMLLIYILCRGNEPLFVKAVEGGLCHSALYVKAAQADI